MSKIILLLCLLTGNCFGGWHTWEEEPVYEPNYIALYPLPKLDVKRDPVIIITPYDHKKKLREFCEYQWAELDNELIWNWHNAGGQFTYIP